MQLPFDAILLVSFGGPERREDVIPFLQNVLRGRNVPPERVEEVAEHYYHFGGKSPINEHCRALLGAIEREMKSRSWSLPLYWGNRNWHPFLVDTLRQMQRDGIRRAVAIITSAFSSYSSCRQYLENIDDARRAIGQPAVEVCRIRPFFNHPGFLAAWSERIREGWLQIPTACRQESLVVFTAHSIPASMAAGCAYEDQLWDAARYLADSLQLPSWTLAYQSRSGPPQQPWLEPDVQDLVEQRHASSPIKYLLVVPLGFLSDHMEVIYDLDVELRSRCEAWGIYMIRVATVGTHPRFITAVVDLVEERLGLRGDRPTVGRLSAWPADCPSDCCPRTAAVAPRPSPAPVNPIPPS